MSRAKAKKQSKGKPRKRGLPRFAWLLIALGIAGVVVFVRLYPMGQPSPNNGGELRAVIVDQLSSMRENEAFVTNITEELEDYGFKVDLYQGDEITVDFYRQLPAQGYELIIFRAHSGLLAEDEVTIAQTTLFTNEEYNQLKHYAEQLDDRLVMARVGEGYPMVFGIPPKFIRESMKGEFDDAVVIMMGCSGIFLRDLAEAFVDKGASVYVAWNGSVELYYVDDATPYLMRQLCSGNLTIKEAMDSTMDVIGPDPEHGAGLKCYPSGSDDKKLEELIK
ncbi:MAG: hypothetical protein WBH01_04690 [Dehalococcoidia bacterium]